jgi:Periplasmic copper-binding protein (NosD)
MKSFAKNSISLTASALALAFAAAGSSAFAATPITRCSLLSSPGSYVLANDIINPAMPANGGICIQATVDRVTLDLAGHTIHASSQTGAAIAGPNSFVVRNGTIEGYQEAVDAQGHATIENLVIDSVRGTAISVADGRVEGNTIVKANQGIKADGSSIIVGNFMKDVATGIGAGTGAIVRDNVIVPSSTGIVEQNEAPGIGLIADNVIRNAPVSILLNPCVGALITANMLSQFPVENGASCNIIDDNAQQ